MEELAYQGKRYRVTLQITPTTRVQECDACRASMRFYAEEVTPTLVEELALSGAVVRTLDPNSSEAQPIALQARMNFVMLRNPSGGAAALLCDRCVGPVP